jgi:hypothetical protein
MHKTPCYEPTSINFTLTKSQVESLNYLLPFICEKVAKRYVILDAFCVVCHLETPFDWW